MLILIGGAAMTGNIIMIYKFSMGELNKAIEDYTVALDKDAESTNEQSISSSPLSQHTRSISTTIK